MPFSPHTLEEKPYNRCLNCDNIGSQCDGPNFLAMSAERRCEWMRLRKEYLHSLEPDKWTNAYIAEESGVSKVTVARVFSGDTKDIRISTIESILKVLVNGSWGKYPCAMAAAADIDRPALLQRAEVAEAECARMREAQAAEQRKIDHLIKETDFLEAQLRHKDRYILALAVLLFAALAVIITGLVVDLVNPDMGFFWRSVVQSF